MITRKKMYQYTCSLCGYIWYSEEKHPAEEMRCLKCQYTNVPWSDIPRWVTSPWTATYTASNIPSACVHCSNHPSNGGSGICNCTLGDRI